MCDTPVNDVLTVFNQPEHKYSIESDSEQLTANGCKFIFMQNKSVADEGYTFNLQRLFLSFYSLFCRKQQPINRTATLNQ